MPNAFVLQYLNASGFYLYHQKWCTVLKLFLRAVVFIAFQLWQFVGFLKATANVVIVVLRSAL